MYMCGFNIKIKVVTTSNVFTKCHTGTGRCKKNCLAFLLLHVSFKDSCLLGLSSVLIFN